MCAPRAGLEAGAGRPAAKLSAGRRDRSLHRGRHAHAVRQERGHTAHRPPAGRQPGVPAPNSNGYQSSDGSRDRPMGWVNSDGKAIHQSCTGSLSMMNYNKVSC